jgi:hypothetical protein
LSALTLRGRCRKAGLSSCTRYDVPSASSGFSGPISGAAEVIESIERVGWQLSNMAYDGKQARNGAVVVLFRRPGLPTP